MRRPDAVVDVSLLLWEQLARDLSSIIGERGFHSLYKRSLLLTIARFPWLEVAGLTSPNVSNFADLKLCLAAQDPAHAGEASSALLITFIDILAVLIGELLTSSILRSAWGDDAMNTVMKELP